MARFYPTKPNEKKEKTANFKKALQDLDFRLDSEYQKRLFDNLEPLSKIEDKAPYKKFHDEFINSVANIGVNNSLLQYSEFIDNRLGYAECAFLRNQHYINNAISAYSDDLIDKGGKFSVIDSVENADDIIKELDKKLKSVDFWSILKKACDNAFTFGGVLIFLDANTGDYENEYYKQFESVVKNPLVSLKLIEPYLASPYEVNTTNPLNRDYMRPKKWYISGGGVVDSSRIETLIFNEAPNLIKPIYNFLGISKVQEMKEPVKNACSLGAMNYEISLRFRTTGIKSPLMKINEDEAIARAKFINKARNNLGLLMMLDTEEYIETATNLSGLDKIQELALQEVASSAYIPRNRLFGDEPSGFSSGEFSTKNYYDKIESMQNTVLKPLILKIAQFFVYSLGYNVKIDFTFAPVAQESAKEKAERENLSVDKIIKLYTNSIIDGEQAFSLAKNDGVILENEVYAFEGEDISEAQSENLINEILSENGEQ